jgi:Tubulin like
VSKAKESHTIQRTLCIGLGGTGRDVLMQIRRLIIDRYGRLDALPVVSFVHIDADRGASDLSGLSTGNTYRGENILFTPAERVTATMTSQEIDQLIGGMEQRSEFDRQSPYDHIKSWLPPQLIRNVKAIEDGAGGIRPVGRLSFFHNYRKIKAAIETAENRTRGHEQVMLGQGFGVEPGLNIFVVGSLCGGTGSGMFLDVAYALRHAYGDIENKLVGYWVVSPELYGDTPGMNANVYAALKELNHYAASNTRFKACYDPQQLIEINEERPPFDFTYLLSNRTATDYRILDKNKLCNVVAHKIFLDFGDELTSVIKSQKDNFKDKLTRLDNHPRRNVQRYLTFGLAKIYSPHDRIVLMALTKVSQRLVNFWLKGTGQSPDSEVLLNRFLLKWGDSSADREFSKRLEGMVKDNGKTFSQTFKTWSSKIEQEIGMVQNAEGRQQILQQLRSETRAQFRKVQPGETDDARGLWLTNIQKSESQLSHLLRNEIGHFFGELLTPSHSEFSLNNARSWLEAILTHIGEYKRGLEEYLQVRSGLSTQESLDTQWRNAELRLQDLEGKKGFLGLFDNKKQKTKDFQVEVSQVFSSAKKLIQDNFDYQVHKTALAVVSEISSFISSLILEAAWIDQLLVSVESSYKKRWEDLERLNPDDITGEALFSPEDANTCYLEFLPEQNEKSILIDISEKILTEKFAFIEKSLMHFLIKVTNEEMTSTGSIIHYLVGSRDVDERLVGGSIAEAIDKLFGTQAIRSLQPVMSRFLQKYPLASSDAERRMRQIISEAQPLLPLLTRDGHFYEDGGNKSEIIAFERTDSRPSQQLQELLTRNVGIAESTIKSIQNDSEIVIVNEYAAFPLRLIQGIGRMREHYDRECQQNRARIHNDYQQVFAEIIPPEARLMEEMQDAFYACLAFGVLIQQDNCYLYEVYDEFRDRKSYIELSLTWSEALEQIAKAGGVANSLRAKRDSVITEIQEYPDRWVEVYLPQLQSFIKKIDGFSKENPNYHEIGVVLGEEGTLDRHATEGILKRLWKYLDKIAKEAQDNPMNRHKKLQTQSSVGDEEVIDADIADVHSS